MRKLRFAVMAALIVAASSVAVNSQDASAYASSGGDALADITVQEPVLSPMWGGRIRRWSKQIEKEASASGLDPDFIAAVVDSESNGDQYAISRAGAVGLMGVMPAGPGLEWRPSAEKLIDPEINLSWGVAILSAIVRQSGGDLVAALAAYSGGWDQASSQVPREYAHRVLDNYARAVAVRSDISPDIAKEWTIGMEIKRGHIPTEPMILGERPVSGLRTYGEHVVFDHVDHSGRAFFVKGYAVPLAVVVPLEDDPGSSRSDTVDDQLLVRLGMSETKKGHSNRRVILACLPSLSRLRGRLATRWFAPSECPEWHR